MKTGLQHILDKDTYRSYLRRVDGRALLRHYGAQHMTEQYAHDGTTEIVHSCLLDRVERHHSNGDQNPSASANLDKKTYVCYSSGLGCDFFHLVMKLEGKESFAEAMGMVGQFLTGATQEATSLQDEISAVFSATNAYQLELPTYDPRVLTAFDHPHPYWEKRGITPAAQQLLRLGYDSREHRVVFPHWVAGSLVGWQKRVIPKETYPDFPKYRNSPGFPKSETLYAHDLADPHGPVLVVESPMSVARAYSIGLRNVVATFGAKVNEAQIALLRPHEKVIVWFDADPAGMAGEAKLVEGLYRHTEVVVVVPESGKDLADYDMVGFCRHTAYNTVPGVLRLGQTDSGRKRRGRKEGFGKDTAQRGARPSFP